MTTTHRPIVYRPIVMPVFMLAESIDGGMPPDMGADFNEEERDAEYIDPCIVQAIHAARAEVLGELKRLRKSAEGTIRMVRVGSGQFDVVQADNGKMVRVEVLDALIDALRASLDDPEEGSA